MSQRFEREGRFDGGVDKVGSHCPKPPVLRQTDNEQPSARQR